MFDATAPLHLRDMPVAVMPARSSLHSPAMLRAHCWRRTGVKHGRYRWPWGCTSKLMLLLPRTSLCFRKRLIKHMV